MSDCNSKLRTLVPVLPGTYLLKLLFLTRYVNCSLERSAVLLASPRGEVASQSDDGEGLWASQLIYRVATKNFPANRLASCVFHAKYEEAICGR